MASDLKTMAGAAMLTMALKAWIIQCASGRFWQSVPVRFTTGGGVLEPESGRRYLRP